MNKIYVTNKEGWGYLCSRSKPERKQELARYAECFLVPALKKYPELYGKVYLALRKNGFFAYKTPVLNIIIPEKCMLNYDEYRLRFITAHELFHLMQFVYGIDSKWNVKYVERQATFMALGRGFALDFVKAFPASCKRNCDMKGRFCYYNCSWIFNKSCRTYTDKEQVILAQQLQDIALRYKISDNIDYLEVVKRNLLVQ